MGMGVQCSVYGLKEEGRKGGWHNGGMEWQAGRGMGVG